MTTDITELAQSLKAAAENATPGEWWADVVETGGTHGSGEDCMEGFHSYAVYDQNNHSLLDMTNSTAAVITVEDDGDYVMAWDEVARRNAEFIALANPANVLALVEALEQAKTERDEFRRRFNLERSILEDADKDLETLRQRIAELESRTVSVKLPVGYTASSGHPFNETERTVMIPGGGDWLNRFDVEHVLAAAGIKWEDE